MASRCTENDVSQCFLVADKDKSGTLQKEEILEVLQNASYPIPDDFDQMLERADKNKDGKIDFHEFAHIFCNNMR